MNLHSISFRVLISFHSISPLPGLRFSLSYGNEWTCFEEQPLRGMYFTPNGEAELAYPKLRCDALHKSDAVIYTGQTKNRFHIFRIGIFFSSVNYHSLGGIIHLPRSFYCLTVPVKQFLYLDLLLFATFDDLKYVYVCFVYSFQDRHTPSRYSCKIFVPFDNCSKTREIINLIGKTG